MNHVIAVAVGILLLLMVAARFAVKAELKKIGQRALDKQPDQVKLEKLSVSAWRDQAAVDALAGPLTRIGFVDCGDYAVDKMPGVKLRILLKADTASAAYLYDHPKAGTWIELSTRYDDGSMTMVVSKPPTGLPTPPFVRKICGPGTPTDALYDRLILIKERPPQGIKRITPDNVVPEYEDAFRRIMHWQKNRGLSAEDVASVAKARLSVRPARP